MKTNIPYTVIGGYLGAGKTTLLNNLLRNSQGLRLAVLVNDFGDINIDADLIAGHDGETINLASGCICCSLADGFMVALGRLSHRIAEIDHIIVEASGVADPVRIGQYGAMLQLAPAGVIVLVDAESVRARAANKYVGETVLRQLAGADLIVLNKVDLIDASECMAVRAWLSDVAPQAPVTEAHYGQVPLSVLLGVHPPLALPQPLAAEETHVDHAAAYVSWSFTAARPLNDAAVRAFVEQLPPGVLRAKGILYLAGDRARQHMLQVVGKRWTLTPGPAWGNEAPSTRLVVIGEPGSFDAALMATLAGELEDL